MKTSKYIYNIYNKENKNYYWFNGLTLKYFQISKKLNDILKEILFETKNFKILKQQSPIFFDKLKLNGFIIDNDFDEIIEIKKLHELEINKKHYYLIILPTLDCNFNCWYCVQNHIKGSKMSEVTIEKIKNHLNRMVVEEKIESLNIEWFGGEPFMYYDEIINPINTFAKDLCKDNNITFLSSATTNAYYLTEEKHKSLINNKIYNYQISLDGVREKHNKVKFTNISKESTFDIALKNINSLINKSKNIRLRLRFNYSDDNLDEKIVEQVNKIIDKKNRKQVDFFMRKVWQEKQNNSRINTVYKINDLFRQSGYNVRQSDINTEFVSCYAERKYYNAIRPDGSIIKCTANDDLYRKDPLGIIDDDGKIIWKEGFLKKFHKIRFDNKHCLTCKHLPICMGNCPMLWETESKLDIFQCRESKVDGHFNDRILNYINEQEKNKSINYEIII